MFIRPSALLLPVLALSSVVAAAPEPIAARTGSSCSNGTLQCCTSTFDVSCHTFLLPEMTINRLTFLSKATQNNLNLLTGLLGIVANIPLVGPLLALNCSPITVLGLGTGANCAQQTVCCQNTQFVSDLYATELEVSHLILLNRPVLSTLAALTSTLACKVKRGDQKSSRWNILKLSCL